MSKYQIISMFMRMGFLVADSVKDGEITGDELKRIFEAAIDEGLFDKIRIKI